MAETPEQIERRLAEIENGSDLLCARLAKAVALIHTLLPALALARAAVALRESHNATELAFDNTTDDEFQAIYDIEIQAQKVYDAALARFADAEGGRP